MKKLVAPIVAVFIGLLLLGPIGAVLAFLIWYLVIRNDTPHTSK